MPYADPPDYYVFDADVYCQGCTDAIKARLVAEGANPDDFQDERKFDSVEWPKGPYSGEESDSPQHCGSGENCVNPHVFPSGFKAGEFFRNPLTSDGERHVREMHEQPNEVTSFWMDHYELNREDD